MSYLLVLSGVRVCAINFSGRIYLRCSFQLNVSINCTMTDCIVYDSCIVYVACLHLLNASSKDISEICLGSNWQKRLCHQFLGVFSRSECVCAIFAGSRTPPSTDGNPPRNWGLNCAIYFGNSVYIYIILSVCWYIYILIYVISFTFIYRT